MATSPLFLGSQRTEQTQFVPGISTRPRILWTAGASGSLIHAINVATNDGGANKVQFGVGKKLTAAADMGTGHFTDGGGSSDTITRSSGSFITDGWRAGDRMLAQGATTLGNDFSALLTAVVAGTLTFATATVDTDEDFAAATALYRLIHTHYVDVALGSGEPDVVAVSGLDTTQMPMLDATPDRQIILGANDVLIGAVTTAMGASEVLDIAVFGGDY